MKKETVKLLEELCKKLEIKIEKLSFGWVYKLSKSNKIRYITGNFDINKEASSKIASDKYATYEVVKSQNLPIIEHKMIFNPNERKKYIEKDIWNICCDEFKAKKKVVVKPNLGLEGKGVFKCKTLDELEKAVKFLLEKNTSISICPYYDIEKEYRAFYLNGKILLIYEKEKPYIVGNGVETIKELVEKLKLPHNKIVKENLEKLDLSYIPNQNEKIEISWKYNLTGGATARVIKKENLIYKTIEELAIRTGKSLDLTFATIDIIKTKENEIYLLEVNSGVSTNIFSNIVKDGKMIEREIYRKALIEMFK